MHRALSPHLIRLHGVLPDLADSWYLVNHREKFNFAFKITEDEMDRTCCTHARNEKSKILAEKTEGKRSVGGLRRR